MRSNCRWSWSPPHAHEACLDANSHIFNYGGKTKRMLTVFDPHFSSKLSFVFLARTSADNNLLLATFMMTLTQIFFGFFDRRNHRTVQKPLGLFYNLLWLCHSAFNKPYHLLFLLLLLLLPFIRSRSQSTDEHRASKNTKVLGSNETDDWWLSLKRNRYKFYRDASSTCIQTVA